MSFASQMAVVKKNIEKSRSVDEFPHIIAVSKRQPDHKIQEALEYGWRVFGENQVQEAYTRWFERKKHMPDLSLHLIGPLQSNKVKQAVQLFDIIHTLDREKIAVKLKREMESAEQDIPCFIQVNIGREASKSGVEPEQTKAFTDFCRHDVGLNTVGLMCIPPVQDNSKAYFTAMQTLQKSCDLKFLSMGMSGDYSDAVRYGSTHVRIGSFLFGNR